MKKLLFITTRLFWPPDSGRKVVLYHYCKGLAERLGYKVHLFSFLEAGQSADEVDKRPGFIESVTLAEPVSKAEVTGNIARALFNRDMPFQCCLFMSRGNRQTLDDLLRCFQPDVVMVDMVRLAPYLDGLDVCGAATVVNFDDLLSKRYRRQVGRTGGSALGKYSDQASGLLKLLVGGPFKDMALSVEAVRCERAEDRYARLTDASLFISPIEAAELDARVGGGSCFCATMGAEAGDPVDPAAPKEYDFGFVGNMHTSANQDSLRIVVDEVLPLLPGTTLSVIGVCPDEVREAYAGNPQVSFTGRVDSIAEHLGGCRALLAPFAYGTGIKTKVLEAMGMGVPVVTNSIGLEGIAAEWGVEVLCAEDPKGLAREARRLLEDEELCESVAVAARSYVMEGHTWEKSIQSLGECVDYARARHERSGQ